MRVISIGILVGECDFRNQRGRLAPLKRSELKELAKKSRVRRTKIGICLLRGVWGSGGFRRVRSCVRSRKLLTKASGTPLASRLRRNKIWDFGGKTLFFLKLFVVENIVFCRKYGFL